MMIETSGRAIGAMLSWRRVSRTPLVTIGFPVYNGGEQFEAALDALRAQTWRNLDILISDNASTDQTEAICRRAAAEGDRIRYVRQPRNLGPTGNFNFVRKQRKGEFFAWAAHDDVRD